MSKNVHEIKVYVSAEEREQIKALAARKGWPVSKLLKTWFAAKLQAELAAERLNELKTSQVA